MRAADARGWRRSRGRHRREKALAPADNRGGWYPILREWTTGAWQANLEVRVEDALRYWAVFRCIAIISDDISKLSLRLVSRGSDKIWKEAENPAWSPLIRKPNAWQTRQQFIAQWVGSLLSHGNTYVLKRYDNRAVVKSLHILDPYRVRPMVSDDGQVFYELRRDNLIGLTEDREMVPAEDIIHDRINTLYHPLVGLSPVYAAGVNAFAGLKIETNTARLFANGARPGGILTAPGAIKDETAARLKAHFDTVYQGENAGKTAVLGDGLDYKTLTMSAADAQVIEQLKWNDTVICGAFGVPAYMLNAGAVPAYTNVEALTQQYYTQCLQARIEAIEALLDEGMSLPADWGVEFNLDDLMRMDTATKVKTLGEGVRGGIYAPNEARARLQLPPVEGGQAVYLQQQNYSLAALDRRDQSEDPFSAAPASPPAAEPGDEPDEPPADEGDQQARAIAVREGALKVLQLAGVGDA